MWILNTNGYVCSVCTVCIAIAVRELKQINLLNLFMRIHAQTQYLPPLCKIVIWKNNNARSHLVVRIVRGRRTHIRTVASGVQDSARQISGYRPRQFVEVHRKAGNTILCRRQLHEILRRTKPIGPLHNFVFISFETWPLLWPDCCPHRMPYNLPWPARRRIHAMGDDPQNRWHCIGISRHPYNAATTMWHSHNYSAQLNTESVLVVRHVRVRVCVCVLGIGNRISLSLVIIFYCFCCAECFYFFYFLLLLLLPLLCVVMIYKNGKIP